MVDADQDSILKNDQHLLGSRRACAGRRGFTFPADASIGGCVELNAFVLKQKKICPPHPF